jgi:hypothetical protein
VETTFWRHLSKNEIEYPKVHSVSVEFGLELSSVHSPSTLNVACFTVPNL